MLRTWLDLRILMKLVSARFAPSLVSSVPSDGTFTDTTTDYSMVRELFNFNMYF